MKLNKRQAAFAISALAVFVLALVLTILEWSGVFTVCSHPILMFFLVAAAGLGVILAVQGFLGKSPFRFFLSAVMFLYVASYCLADFAHMVWWLIVIVDAVIAILFVVISFMMAGSRTEDIALNKSPDYKNYEQRSAEREEKEKAEEENYVPPEIKSFKDEK